MHATPSLHAARVSEDDGSQPAELTLETKKKIVLQSMKKETLPAPIHYFSAQFGGIQDAHMKGRMHYFSPTHLPMTWGT